MMNGVKRPAPPRLNKALAISLIVIIECILLLVIAEAITRMFLPAGLTFIHPQVLMEPSKTRMYQHRPNQHAFTMDKPFHTNSMGFRDDREVPAHKGNEFRILSLGDSLAVGWGAAEKETYAAQLEQLLARRYGEVRVINGGAGSYSTWQEVELLKESGLALHPDIVLVAFFWNDLYVKPDPVVPLSPTQSGEQQDATMKYVRWFKRSSFLMFLWQRAQLLRMKIAPTFDWNHQENIYEGRSDLYLERAYEDIAKSLMELKSLADIHGFVPILVILPIPGQVHHMDSSTHMQGRMASIAKRTGIRMLDVLRPLQEAYAANPDLFITWDNTHFSARGHKIVADAIERYLTKESLVPVQQVKSLPASSFLSRSMLAAVD